MMTRAIRKAVSIVCAVALVMSLCVVSIVGTSSAIKLSDDVETVESSTTLTFDTGKGVADWRGETGSIKDDPAPSATGDKAAYIGTNGVGSPQIVLGSSDSAELNAANGSHYVFENGKSYRISFKYKISKDTKRSVAGGGAAILKFYALTMNADGKSGSNPVDVTNNVGAGNGLQFKLDDTNSTVEGDFYKLTNDSDWLTYSLTYSCTRSTHPAFGIMMVGENKTGSFAGLYIDDVVVEKISVVHNESEVEEYTIDFADKDTGNVWNPRNHSIFSRSDKSDAWKSYIDSDKIAHLTVYNNNASNAVVTWRNNFMVYDPDFGGDPYNYIQFKSGKSYYVSVEYKLAASQVGGGSLAISYTGEPTRMAGGIAWTDYITCDNTDVTAEAAGDWQTLTTSFSADEKGIVDKYLQLTACSGNNTTNSASANRDGCFTQFLIKSITVKEYDTSATAIVKFNSNGGSRTDDIFVKAGSKVVLPTPKHSDTDRIFAGWYTDNTFKTVVDSDWTPSAGTTTLYAKWVTTYVNVTKNNCGVITNEKLAVGTPLANAVRPNTEIFFEGWYTDAEFTNRVKTVPEYDCTLYAKYNYTYIPFNEGGVSDSTSNMEIIADPDNAENKVLKHTTVKGASYNFELGSYDAAKSEIIPYTLQLNTRYYITFRVKVPAGQEAGLLTLYTGGQSAYSADASKTPLGLSYTWSVNDGTNGTDWITLSTFFETGDTFYKERVNFTVQNHIYFTLCGLGTENVNNSSSAEIYIDDIRIGVYSEEVPEGAVGVYYKTNGSEVAPSFGYAGENYTAPAEPILSAHKFMGWYTNKSLTVPFTSTTFPNETITLYAKWEALDWIVNFDRYATTSMSGRYNLTKEGDNNILRYNYEQGKASSTAAASATARATLNKGADDAYRVIDGVKYIVTFKYKVDKEGFNQAGVIKAVTHDKFSTWANSKEQSGNLPVSGATDGWQKGSFEFTASLNSTGEYLSIGMNGDYTAYIDDIQVATSFDSANIYGSTIINIDTNGGPEMYPISGDPGDAIELPAAPSRAGYRFKGWYKDQLCNTKFTDTVYGEEGTTIYAGWILGKFAEGFEDFPTSVSTQGISGVYTLYNSSVSGFDKANVQSGSTSIFRDGTGKGTKAFTICRSDDLALEKGEQYTLTFYIKPTAVNDATGVINMVGMTANTSISAVDETVAIADVGTLKVGEWQQISYTFTANSPYIGISTTTGNDIYFDNFTVTLKGYTGSSTGDSSVSPFIILAMVVLAAGAMVVTGKKVFAR